MRTLGFPTGVNRADGFDATGLAPGERPAPSDLSENDPTSIESEDATPRYLDDGITAYIVEWGAELGDDDQERSINRAHRVWWNSKLERWRFHNAMKAAKHVTLARIARGQVSGRPMAYFFGVLTGAAADECVKAGLPMPRGVDKAEEGEEAGKWDQERVG